MQKSTVLIVGAGALENAWNPIIKSFKNVCNWDLDIDGANFSFARLVYLMRFYSKVEHTESESNLVELKKNIKHLKEEIAKELKIAQQRGEIHERKAFQIILKKFIFTNSNRFCLISTNWDTVIDNSINRFIKLNNLPYKSVNTFHIHGIIDNPNEMYLPSEITNENYRSKEEDRIHGENHSLMINIINEATKIIIYGLSLDPLDAELSQTLFAGMSQNLKEIIIIDPNYNKVAKRVLLLLNSREKRYKVKVECYDPLKIL
jgi:hypothetical protein